MATGDTRGTEPPCRAFRGPILATAKDGKQNQVPPLLRPPDSWLPKLPRTVERLTARPTPAESASAAVPLQGSRRATAQLRECGVAGRKSRDRFSGSGKRSRAETRSGHHGGTLSVRFGRMAQGPGMAPSAPGSELTAGGNPRCFSLSPREYSGPDKWDQRKSIVEGSSLEASLRVTSLCSFSCKCQESPSHRNHP